MERPESGTFEPGAPASGMAASGASGREASGSAWSRPDRSLPRTERLRSLGAVQRVFQSGESGFVFPFRYVWFAEADPVPSVEVLFTVPKKFHKRAHKRNLLRRRTKEAYRLQKQIVHTAGRGVNLDLALVYSSKEELSYKQIANAVRRILESVAEHL